MAGKKQSDEGSEHRSKIVRYVHHDNTVAVMAENKGKHRDNCLCYRCERFDPEGLRAIQHCKIAEHLYNFCKLVGIVTPVWECPYFTDLTKEEVKAIETENAKRRREKELQAKRARFIPET